MSEATNFKNNKTGQQIDLVDQDARDQISTLNETLTELTTWTYKQNTSSGCRYRASYNSDIALLCLWQPDAVVTTEGNSEILTLPEGWSINIDGLYYQGVMLNPNWSPSDITLTFSVTPSGISVRGSQAGSGVVCLTMVLPRTILIIPD